MALVTVQCSNSDGEGEDEENNKNEKSECFFAGKGTALVLAMKDLPKNPERRLSTDSTQSNNSDIQQHLQSMFNLMRHEDTLKMAVKLESQRPNRTRYLVIASCCCYRTSTTDRKSKIIRNNSTRQANASPLSHPSMASAHGTSAQMSASSSTTTRQISNDSNKSQQIQQAIEVDQQQQIHKEIGADSNNTNNNVAMNDPCEKRLSFTSTSMSMSTCSNRQSIKCDADKNTASGDSKCPDEGIEESCLLGIDCNERTTIGLVVPILADTTIRLDGDGGFSVSVYGKTHIFKPVSVQAMWSALQTLHKVSQKARENNFYPGGPSHDWLSYYESRIESDQSCLNEWNTMDSIESRRPPSPDAIRNKPTAKEETEGVIKMKLKEIMMSVDLDEVTSKYIRGRLEEHLDMDLGEYKSFIDQEMLIILGQMDAPTEIFEHVYLGSEWNASNLEELQKNGVRHILNVTREIDNFFPGLFDYFNVRVYDDEKTDLLKHWDNTFRYITRAKSEGSKVLVHCKMGVSRSASVVIAYAMKAYNWEFQHALQHVKERRSCIKPNKNFLNQLETYRGMLDAMKNKEKLQRSKSETNLKSSKDARLLPGSEPTPLIQALNQSKSKSAGHGVSGDTGAVEEGKSSDLSSCISVAFGDLSGVILNSASEQKQRRVMRRSSSTSPKTIQSHAAIAVVRQQSQSLEHLTPERSIADEPKNVRYPGSNGENYSVTQNQVLHIQKNTPPPPPPPPPVPKPTTIKTSNPPTSVRTRVYNFEANRDTRKTTEDRKTLNLQFVRSVSHDTNSARAQVANLTSGDDGISTSTSQNVGSTRSLGSPVWTSSAKLVTQTSTLDPVDLSSLRNSLRSRRDTINSSGSNNDTTELFTDQTSCTTTSKDDQGKLRSRKTYSWAATSGSSGGIVVDTQLSESPLSKLGSNNSIDSTSSSNRVDSGPPIDSAYGNYVRPRLRQRELPSRHASWGSGDNRSSIPIRNSSWNSYDSNRNAFQYGGTTASPYAIVEGQIHNELNKSYKTASNIQNDETMTTEKTEQKENLCHHMSTVKRTKQKLEECTIQKKLCQENEDAAIGSDFQQKRTTNLYRSASAAGATQTQSLRCNSEELVPDAIAVSAINTMGVQHLQGVDRRGDSNKILHSEIFAPSAAESYTVSDIENKNSVPPDISEVDEPVVLRSHAICEDNEYLPIADQRISGNVQILKKNFEAKATTTNVTSNATQSISNAVSGRKGHQSLPSSPVAQHVNHSASNLNEVKGMGNTSGGGFFEHSSGTVGAIVTENETIPTAATSGNSSSSSSSSTTSSSSSVSETHDRNVKGLVHKYQTTTSSTNISTSSTSAATATTLIAPISTTPYHHSVYKQRPRSCYENSLALKSLTGKPHDFSDNRPPPAPLKTNLNTTSISSTSSQNPPTAFTTPKTMTENLLLQQQQQQHQHQHRRLQQHGKTHPLARISLSKPSINAAAYNTM